MKQFFKDEWIPLFIGSVIIILLSVCTITVITEVEKKGLKNIVERIWEGKK